MGKYCRTGIKWEGECDTWILRALMWWLFLQKMEKSEYFVVVVIEKATQPKCCQPQKCWGWLVFFGLYAWSRGGLRWMSFGALWLLWKFFFVHLPGMNTATLKEEGWPINWLCVCVSLVCVTERERVFMMAHPLAHSLDWTLLVAAVTPRNFTCQTSCRLNSHSNKESKPVLLFRQQPGPL